MMQLQRKQTTGVIMQGDGEESHQTVGGVRLLASADIVAAHEDWPQIWFSFARHAWRSMVLVPAHPGLSVLGVARALADAGRTYEEPTLSLIEAERVSPSRVHGIISEVRDRSALDQRTIIAVASPMEDNGAIPIIRGCDVGVLVIPLGETPMAAARRTLAVVGRGSFLGAITVTSR
jgi:hypothetical protein